MEQKKFRAWDEDNKRMFIPLSVDNRDVWEDDGKICGAYHCWYQRSQCSDDGEMIEVTPQHLMQFVGITDKNGIDIYEGDRIKYLDLVGDVHIETITDMCSWLQEYGYSREELMSYNDIEIIGDVYNERNKV